MSEKLMSIMVLNWNRKKYSVPTIENILKKTTMRHELILIDNNSADESGVKEYLDTVVGNNYTQNVVRVYNSKNLGVAGGRNSGLSIASGEYLVTVDDDVLVPDKWDVLMVQACDKIPKLGITGVNVEPIKFPVRIINGIRVRPKNGNLGGACLCLPRRVFKRVGFYNYFNTYGMEDCAMFYRLKHIGLSSIYIEPKGIHMDEDLDKAYRVEKNKAQTRKSPQMKQMAGYLAKMRKTNNVYVSFDSDYEPPDMKVFTNELIIGGDKDA